MASNWRDVFGFPKGEVKKAKMTLIPIDAASGVPLASMGSFSLPYYPESLDLNFGSIGWQESQIPGWAHSIFQWTGNSSPTLSFPINLSCDIDPAFYEPEDTTGYDPFNLNLNAVAAWLRALTMPEAIRDNLSPQLRQAVRALGGDTRTRIESPPIVQVVPEGITQGSVLGEAAAALGGFANGGDRRTPIKDRGLFLSMVPYQDFYGIVDSLSINYKSFFTSGFPRLIDVQISLRQVIQIGDMILPQYRSDVLELARSFDFSGNSTTRRRS
jgi:hypothetical protein